MSELSPMMKQYNDIKEQYTDCILFFRLGDFYEMFFDDAILASKELEITLTGRDCAQEDKAPMCGVPFHSVDGYIDKLIEKGYKVAICEQVEDPAASKGIVKRDVVRVVTSGTTTSDNLLDSKKNNYLCSVYYDEAGSGVAFVDVTTGEMSATEILGIDSKKELLAELSRGLPSEMLFHKAFDDQEYLNVIKEKIVANIEMLDDTFFHYESANEAIMQQFSENPVTASKYLTQAIGALILYLFQTQKRSMPHISNVNVYSQTQFMSLDFSTRRNLELTATMREGKKRGSLLWVLDQTKTAMGGRMLRSWIDKPLISCAQIRRRQNAVNELVQNPIIRGELRELLIPVQDIERLASKIVTGSALPRDLLSLAVSAQSLPDIKSILATCTSDILSDYFNELDVLEDVAKLISFAINPDAPFSIREGGIIKEGYNEAVDNYRHSMNKGVAWLAEIEAQEREATGIKNLKIGFNKVFGYYIEVTKSNIANVPDRYVRKQTLTNCERYITGQLKEIENSVLGAQERNYQLEYELYCELRDEIARENKRIISTAQLIAGIDTICSLAECAACNNYTMPEINNSDSIIIKDGRHPVIEQIQKKSLFVPNDTHLTRDERFWIITGPNMAGKSTYMRQVALITLMAQIGSFVPASSAEIGVVDKIFTRVGASDDLSAGQSTFMVEMSEVAHILNNATKQSLVILDEIGRGTSTYDGLSIAWAVVEYMADIKKLGAKTVFATHYHELTELEGKVDGVYNYCIAVKKRGDEIIFLRKIIKGGADDSYGVEVAMLAGVRKEVIKRAKEILSTLEVNDINRVGNVDMNKHSCTSHRDEHLPLFEANYSEITDEIKKLDITTLTPIEAMNKLYELKQKCDLL